MREDKNDGSGIGTDIVIIIIVLGLLAGLVVGVWHLVTKYGGPRATDKQQPGRPPFEQGAEAPRPLDADNPPLLELGRMKTFKVPRYRGKVPSVFDDITWLEREKRLMAANSIGIGEFPLRGGEPVFNSPGFTAECPGCEMRGFVQTREVPTTALVWAKRALSVSLSRRKAVDYRLPDEISDPSGLAYDGTYYLVSDRKANTVFRLQPDEKEGQARIVSKVECDGPVEAVAYHEGILWIAYGNLLKGYSQADDKWIEMPPLANEVSGIVFAEGYLWATAKDEPVIYRFDAP